MPHEQTPVPYDVMHENAMDTNQRINRERATMQDRIATLARLYNIDDEGNVKLKDLNPGFPSAAEMIDIAFKDRWTLNNPASFVDRHQIDQDYDQFRNGSERYHGAQLSQQLLAEDLYSVRYLPLIDNMMRTAQITGDKKAEVHGYQALDTLQEALSRIDRYAEEHDIPKDEAFQQMCSETLNGTSEFFMMMKYARRTAMEYIINNHQLIQGTTQEEDAGFIAEANAAILEYADAEFGIPFNDEFIHQLFDPNTRAVVISLDWNSTWTQKESFATPHLIAEAGHKMQTFAKAFKKRFPDKQLYMPINTGRPGLYAWGVVEALQPIEEMRTTALGEAGGTVIAKGIESSLMQVGVENPQAWQGELDKIKGHLVSRIRGSKTIPPTIEPKLSMLSMQLADVHGGTNHYRHETIDGQVVNEHWVQTELKSFAAATRAELQSRYTDLQRRTSVHIPDLETVVNQALEQYHATNGNGNGNGNGKKPAWEEVRARVKAHFAESLHTLIDGYTQELEEIGDELDTLDVMFGTDQQSAKLVAKYNPTVGYVDIGHADLNKYSTLMNVVTNMEGISRDQVMFVAVGDTGTDIPPGDRTGRGEVNEGADDAYLIGVRDSHLKLKVAAAKRGNHGHITARDSVLAVNDLFKGLINLVRGKLTVK